MAEPMELRVGIEVLAFQRLACFVAGWIVTTSPGLEAVIKEILLGSSLRGRFDLKSKLLFELIFKTAWLDSFD